MITGANEDKHEKVLAHMSSTNDAILKNLQALTKIQESSDKQLETGLQIKKRKSVDMEKGGSDVETDEYEGETFFVCFTKITASKKRGWSYNLEYILCDGTEDGKEYCGTFLELSKKDLYPTLMSNILAEGWVTNEFKAQVDVLIDQGTLQSDDIKHQSLYNVKYMPNERVLSKKEVKERIAKIQEGDADPSQYISAERDLIKT